LSKSKDVAGEKPAVNANYSTSPPPHPILSVCGSCHFALLGLDRRINSKSGNIQLFRITREAG